MVCVLSFSNKFTTLSMGLIEEAFAQENANKTNARQRIIALRNSACA